MSDESMVYCSNEPYLSKHINDLGCRFGLPVSGTFEITTRCNFNCKMCYIHSSENAIDEMSAEKWLQLASKAKKAGLLFLLITGGEPFIRKDFAEIYSGIIEMGIIVSINTNASLYNDEIRELFKKYPPSRINVSLYGASNECYGRMCGNAAFEKVFENIKKMQDDGLNVRLNVSLTPSNICDMEKINAIAMKQNLQSKATTYMYPPVRISSLLGENPGRFSADEAGIQFAHWYSIHDSKEKFSARAKLMGSQQLKEPVSDKSRCRAGRCCFWITCDGKMLPCGTMNVDSSDPFELGFDAAWQEVRKRTEEIRMPKKCTTCPKRDFCGVCAAVCKDETGSFSEVPEYVCEFSESLKNEVLRIEKERNNANP